MNKLLILTLAICVMSVHAFVKRDAPEADKGITPYDDMKKQIDDFSKKMEEGIKENFDPDHIKKRFNEIVDNVTKFVNNAKSTPEAPK